MKHLAVVFAVLAASLGIATFGQVSNSSASSDTGAAAESKPVRLKFAEQKRATASQRNAVRAAESYLEYTAFSKKGLEKQLRFEGYSSAAARYGASHVHANWNQEAVKAAKSYLEYTSFSKSGLVEQLEFEGFTPSQAQYGVSRAYH
jgi:enterochelin esterase-like enzyme